MRSDGFTLLELMVVLCITGILLTLVTPNFLNNKHRILEDAADRLAMLINQARQDAVLSSSLWQLVIDPATGTYYFRKRIKSRFEKIVNRPFTERKLAPSIEFSHLEINGQQLISTAEINLFPTGEQDEIKLVMNTGEYKSMLTMGPFGPAQVKLQ